MSSSRSNRPRRESRARTRRSRRSRTVAANARSASSSIAPIRKRARGRRSPVSHPLRVASCAPISTIAAPFPPTGPRYPDVTRRCCAWRSRSSKSPPSPETACMYTASGTLDVEQRISEFAPLVRRMAHHLAAKLPASVQIDDIIQAGMIGLMDAASRFEEAQGCQFETFASQRIRGAMLDELRQNDWLPRSMRKSLRTLEAAISEARAVARPRADRKGDRRRAEAAAHRLSRAAAGRARLPAAAFRGLRARRRGRLSRAPSAGRAREPVRALQGLALPRCADPGDRGPAAAREAAARPLLRAGIELQGDRGGSRSVRVAGLPAARAGGRAAAEQADGLVAVTQEPTGTFSAPGAFAGATSRQVNALTAVEGYKQQPALKQAGFD